MCVILCSYEGEASKRSPNPPIVACAPSRNAVQSYLATSIKASPITHNGAGAGGNGGSSGRQNPSPRRSRSLSPKALQRNRWCSPIRSSPIGSDGGAHTDGRRAGAGEPAGLGAVFEKEGVPPLLLAPAEWGIGLGGEWVSARGTQTIRGTRLTKNLRVVLHDVLVGVYVYS